MMMDLWLCSFEIAWVISSDDGLIRETIRGIYYLK
jgi:hypothetical protein